MAATSTEKAPYTDSEKQEIEQNSIASASKSGRISDVDLAYYYEENAGSAFCFRLLESAYKTD